MKKIIISFIALAMLCSVGFALEQKGIPQENSVSTSGIAGSLLDVRLIQQTVRGKKKALNSRDRKDVITKEILAITFQLTNNDLERKFDLGEQFVFSLKDEHENVFRLLPLPENYPYEVLFSNKSYPSLYPNEHFGQTIFFEAPLEESKKLTLTIDPQTTEEKNNISLDIKQKDIKGIDRILNVRKPTDDDISIISPKDGSPVKPGDIVYVEIDLAEDIRKPDSIYLIAPHYVLEDHEINDSYDLRIPLDQKSGPFTVIVMAKWGEAQDHMSISKSFSLVVLNPKDIYYGI